MQKRLRIASEHIDEDLSASRRREAQAQAKVRSLAQELKEKGAKLSKVSRPRSSHECTSPAGETCGTCFSEKDAIVLSHCDTAQACCVQKQRSPLHDYMRAQLQHEFQILSADLAGDGQEAAGPDRSQQSLQNKLEEMTRECVALKLRAKHYQSARDNGDAADRGIALQHTLRALHDAKVELQEQNEHLLSMPSKRNSKGIKISSVNMQRLTHHAARRVRFIEGNMWHGLPIAGILPPQRRTMQSSHRSRPVSHASNLRVRTSHKEFKPVAAPISLFAGFSKMQNTKGRLPVN